MGIVFRHRKHPCVFIWNCTEKNWDIVEDYLTKEIKEHGFKNFVIEETKLEPVEDPEE